MLLATIPDYKAEEKKKEENGEEVEDLTDIADFLNIPK